MITFKTYSHSFKLMILVFSVGLTACSIPDPQKKSPEDVAGSTFYFDSVDGDLVSENIQGPFKLPTSKEYKVSTCLKDKAYNKPLPSQRFKIEEINQSLVTDAKGCLNWTEKVEYEFLGKSQYVLIPRTITSLSGQTGSIKLKLLMNPWSHGENLSKVFELSRTKLNQYSLRTEDLKNALERPLWADKASFFYQTETKETDGTVFNFDFQTTPQIMLSKMNGDNSFFDLKEGTFQAEFYMIHYLADQGQDKYTKLSTFKTKEPIAMKAGIFSLKTQFKISNKPERGQLFLGLKLTPVGGPQGLKTFNGLYALGDAKSFRINSAMIRLQSQASQNPKFDLDKDLNLGGESSSNTNTNSASLNTYRSSGLDLTKINITFSNISSEHTTDKEIHYKIQTCLIDSTDNSPMRAEQIEIQSPNIVYVSDKKQKTNESTGCFEWTEKMAFKRYECQHPVAREVHFISKNLNFNKTIKYYVNPWETWGRFYYDARWESPDNETLNKCQKQDKAKSLLYLTKYSLTQTHTNFEVDNFLNLSTNHEYLLELNAEVRSPGNLFVGRKDKEEITSGFYLLRMAIVHNKEYAGDTGVVTILKKIVPISQGKVLLNFKTKALDLKSLFARNEIIFELEPINDQKINPNSKSSDSIELLNPSEGLDSAVDANSGLITQAFMGQVLLKDKDNSQSLIPLNSSVIKAYLFNDFKDVKNSPSIILGLEKTFNQDLQKLQANLVQVSQFSELEKSQNLKLVNIRKNDDTLKTFLEKSDQLQLKHLTNELYYEKPSPYLASKLCSYFVGYLLKESISPYYISPIYRSCYEMSVRDPQNMFITESFWKIGKVISAEMIAGQPSGLNISSGYSMRRSYSQSNTDSTSISASVAAKIPLDKIPIIGQFFSLGITGSASHQIQSVESKSKDGASGISELMNLDVQHYTFKIKLSDYEKCFVIRINPRHFQESDQLFTDKMLNMFDIAKPLNIHEKMKSNITQIEKLQKLTQGVLICSGEKIQTPIEKFENYYLISQDLKTNSQQEGGDLRNQMFFASLRGAQDYDRFIAILNSKISLPSSYQNLTENQFHSLTKHVQEVIKAAQTHPGFYSATGNSAP